jgi:bacterioferritin (cytochrome b1)
MQGDTELAVRIGQTVREQFESDLAIVYEVAERLRPGIAPASKHRTGNAGIPPVPSCLRR